MISLAPLHGLLLLVPLAAGGGERSAAPAAEPGSPGGAGLALRCAKALVCGADPGTGQVVNHAVVLVRDGLVERVGRAADTHVPAGYEVLELGDRWVMPGMIDLHSHIGGSGGLNDTVYQANPGLRINNSVVPYNPRLQVCLAAGVTTVLFIPGSGSNVGGGGVLMKTGFPTYGETVLRETGSLKIAQGDNPRRWGYGMNRVMMNWVIRDTLRRGTAYAERWRAFEAGEGPEPERDVQFDIFRELTAGRAQVSTHTQVPQLVLATLSIIRLEFDLPVFLDHSTVGGWKYGALAQELGVPAIVGPRSVDSVSRGMINWSQNRVTGFRGVAAGYQQNGHQLIGFNTDAPVIPAEDLFLQAAMGVRYGLDDSRLESVRGLTIVPAIAVGMEHRVGSLEAGKDADLVVISGHPADPRSSVDLVYIEGRRVYDTGAEARRY